MTDKLNAAGLAELFGRAIMAKLTRGMERPGKHNAARRGTVNPPGTKFVRRCIRNSGRESTYNRQLYAYLTGHQYAGTSK